MYKCVPSDGCQRTEHPQPADGGTVNVTSQMFSSLDVCRTVCGRFGGLWPKPVTAALSMQTVPIHPNYLRWEADRLFLLSFFKRKTAGGVYWTLCWQHSQAEHWGIQIQTAMCMLCLFVFLFAKRTLFMDSWQWLLWYLSDNKRAPLHCIFNAISRYLGRYTTDATYHLTRCYWTWAQNGLSKYLCISPEYDIIILSI